MHKHSISSYEAITLDKLQFSITPMPFHTNTWFIHVITAKMLYSVYFERVYISPKCTVIHSQLDQTLKMQCIVGYLSRRKSFFYHREPRFRFKWICKALKLIWECKFIQIQRWLKLEEHLLVTRWLRDWGTGQTVVYSNPSTRDNLNLHSSHT